MKQRLFLLVALILQLSSCVKSEWKVRVSEKHSISFSSDTKDCGVLLREVPYGHYDILVTCIKKVAVANSIIFGTLCKPNKMSDRQEVKTCPEIKFLFFTASEKLETSSGVEFANLFIKLKSSFEPVPYLNFRPSERVALWSTQPKD